MYEILEEVFTELEAENGTPYSRQGSYEIDEKLPDDFYTFWNASSEYDGYYGNKPTKCIWEWTIFFYTNNPANIYDGMNNFLDKAKEYGFIIKGRGRDIATDEQNYFGRYATIEYAQNLN